MVIFFSIRGQNSSWNVSFPVMIKVVVAQHQAWSTFWTSNKNLRLFDWDRSSVLISDKVVRQMLKHNPDGVCWVGPGCGGVGAVYQIVFPLRHSTKLPLQRFSSAVSLLALWFSVSWAQPLCPAIKSDCSKMIVITLHRSTLGCSLSQTTSKSYRCVGRLIVNCIFHHVFFVIYNVHQTLRRKQLPHNTCFCIWLSFVSCGKPGGALPHRDTLQSTSVPAWTLPRTRLTQTSTVKSCPNFNFFLWFPSITFCLWAQRQHN